ncbi:MAG: ribose transport system ATP-binding protein [Actinomycetota bacterium]|nr:ribose transport system ATP-binding protein [Actinomycetota bacterium]
MTDPEDGRARHRRGTPGTGTPTSTPILQLTGLRKRFGSTWVLNDVDLRVDAGQVHGLLGQNGSGKSTLIKVLAGFHAPDGGTLELDGKQVALPLAPRERRQHRLEFVHQDLALIPSLTVLENLLANDLAFRRGLSPLRARREATRARELFDRFGLGLHPSALVRDISRLARAQLAIARAAGRLGADTRGLLVLDEPTAFLPRAEAEQLFTLMRNVATQGAGVLFVSHDLDEVLQVTDRVSVLRDGVMAGSVDTADTTHDGLVRLIVGRSVAAARATARPAEPADPAAGVHVEKLRGPLVRDVSFSIGRGEILGLTGVIGSGFEEIPHLLFGSHRATGGVLSLDGDRFDLTRLTPAKAVRAGLALIPAERATDGSAPSLTVGENVALLSLRRSGGPARVTNRKLHAHTGGLLRDLDVRPPEPRLPYSSLSGGNQQKALLAKWLVTEPRVLMLSEPTQGVDIGAREQIFALISQVAARGCTVLCASSDLEQLAQLCHRVLVLRRGTITDEVTGDDVTKAGLTDVLYRRSPAEAL